jgi:SOS response regulatory protein OraA/RecX
VPTAAAAALADVFADADETSLADAALGSRPVAHAAEQRRAVAFLVRRGFSAGVAWQVVGARSRR